MKRSLSILLVAAIAVAGCKGSDRASRRGQQYEVVQEGSASGVTSTINGPGETTPPMVAAPMTGTNADTTSNFTLPGTQPGGVASGQPGTLAGTLPTGGSMSAYPPGSAYPVQTPPADARPRPTSNISITRSQTPAATRPVATTPVAPPPMHSSVPDQPATTATTDTSSATATTSTSSTTSTQPSTDTSQTNPPSEEKAKKSKEKENPPPPSDDQPAPQPAPPPPPPPGGVQA